MAETLDLAFEWNVAEHARAQRAILIARLRQEGALMLVWAAAGVLGFLDLAAVYLDIHYETNVLMWIVFPMSALFLLVFGIQVWLRPTLDARQARSGDSNLRYPIHHLFDDHGLRVRGRSAEVTLNWKSMRRVVETREFVMFFHTTRNAYYLPKRVIPAEQLAELRTMILAGARPVAEIQES